MPPRKPDIAGDAGLAWKVPIERLRSWAQEHPEKIDPKTIDTTWIQFFVNGRDWHPFWQWWVITLIDLDDREGHPPPQRVYQGAQWELSCYSLNPAYGEPQVNGYGGWAPMFPPDLILHFHGLEAGQAKDVAKFFVEAICAGRTSPDSDWERSNRERLNELIRDYYIGRYGGKVRTHKPELDPYTNQFTGREEETPWARQQSSA